MPLGVLLAICPIQAGFCECANLDEPCSHKDNANSSIPKCCPKDRISGDPLKCDATEVEQIGTCIKDEEDEEKK